MYVQFIQKSYIINRYIVLAYTMKYEPKSKWCYCRPRSIAIIINILSCTDKCHTAGQRVIFYYTW